MQDVRRKKPIKYNKDGSVSLDGSGVKILRLLDPQGEPDVIECDGIRYVPEQRYQQLAEGARDLFKAVEPMHEQCNEDTCCNLVDMGWLSGCCFQDLREQLKRLGVIVDD